MQNDWQKVKQLVLSQINPEIINRLNLITNLLNEDEKIVMSIILKYDRNTIPSDFTSTSLLLNEKGLSPAVYCGTIKINNVDYKLLLGNDLTEEQSFKYPASIKKSLDQITDVLKLDTELIFAIERFSAPDNVDVLTQKLFNECAIKIKEKMFPSRNWICYKNI